MNDNFFVTFDRLEDCMPHSSFSKMCMIIESSLKCVSIIETEIVYADLKRNLIIVNYNINLNRY